MTFESNVADVRDRLARFRNQTLPQAIARALHPDNWREPARAAADSTLRALATADQAQFIPDFINTLMAGVIPEGFWLRLRSPFSDLQTVADFQAARQAVSPSDLGQNLFYKDLGAFDDLITEWVATEKRKDARDAGKSDEEIAHFIAHLMLTPNPTPKELAARTKLMPHIADFLQRKHAMSRLAPEVVNIWLRAVLCAWRELVCARMPHMVRSELKSLNEELRNGEGRKAA